MRTTEERVDRLDGLMERLVEEHIKTEEAIRDLKEEMAEVKDEMAEFKDEMREFKTDMQGFKSESNKRWGELANRLGTVIEDIILPGTPHALMKKFGIEINTAYARAKMRHPVTRQLEEFDLVITGSDGRVYCIEVKSKVNHAAVEWAIDKSAHLKADYFPDKEVVSILGTLFCDNDSVIGYASNKGVFVLAMNGDYLEIVN